MHVTTLAWVTWNLMLAAIPAITGYPLAAAIEKWTVRKHKVSWAIWAIPILAWFAFLPNTCYLLTEWRHFLFDDRFANIRYDNADNPYVMLTVARQGLFFLAYSAAGALCFALAVRPMHHMLRKTHFNLATISIPFFMLTSLGVYLGLILRLNSWDVATRPLYVAHAVFRAFTVPRLLEVVVIFAGLLWLLYMILDMWVDGFKLRFANGSRGK